MADFSADDYDIEYDEPEDKPILAKVPNTSGWKEIKSGYLSKVATFKHLSLHRRYFILWNTKQLWYYEDNSKKTLLDMIELDENNAYAIGYPSFSRKLDSKTSFDLVTKRRTYHFQADNEQDCKNWVNKLQQFIKTTILPAKLEGLLHKEGLRHKTFRPRWFLLTASKNLFYFVSQQDCERFKRVARKDMGKAWAYALGVIPINKDHVSLIEKGEYYGAYNCVISITYKHAGGKTRIYRLSCKDSSEMNNWHSAIRSSLESPVDKNSTQETLEACTALNKVKHRTIHGVVSVVDGAKKGVEKAIHFVSDKSKK